MTLQKQMKALAERAQSIGGGPVDDYRRGGGKVIGYACLLTPLELLDAAGAYPYRIMALGNSRTDLADARLARYNCGYCRACLQLVLEGQYDFLDGVIESNGCDQLRGMFENWQYAKPSPFFHYLKAPHLLSEDAMAYFEQELTKMRGALEQGLDVEITDENLWDAIARQERIRDLLAGLFALREGPNLRVLGSEVLSIMAAMGAMTPDEFERVLREILPRLKKRKGHRGKGPRLLLGGAATDEIDMVRDIEGLGAHLVADTLCFGSRLFRAQLDRPRFDDPLKTIADRTLGASLCPRMYEEFPKRLETLISEVQRASVEGVLLVHNKFCDVHGIDNAMLRLKLEERGIPVLTLEKEYGAVADRGRIKTRVQAFMERIGDRS
jgi:benzoyl-CoA reductase/2-hydroxyglutaryl-CoA dehydratase subunit BcrC/BadD/HgdB